MPPEADASDDFRYDVFISYSRTDRTFVEKLVRALTRYTAPHDLNLPRRRLNIFLDRTDLVGADYYASIDRALAGARKLVLICSPGAASSRYVEDEVRRFINRRGADHVIPVLLSGTPNNEIEAADADQAAFPQVLVDSLALPLAVDFRGFDAKRDKPQRAGYRDAWFSLLARLLDRERSEIEQRERARRARQRRAWGTAAVTLIIVLTALTLFAFEQKNEAQRQALISRASYLAAESRVHLEGDARLSFLLARHAWEMTPGPAARRNLIAAFYRNSFAYVDAHDAQQQTLPVYASPFYRHVNDRTDPVEVMALRQECPDPMPIFFEPPGNDETDAVRFGSGSLSLRFDGLVINGKPLAPVQLGQYLATRHVDYADDPRLNCISDVVLSPTGDSAVLIFPYPRPAAALWRPPSSPGGQGESWLLSGIAAVRAAAVSADGLHVALLDQHGSLTLWRQPGIIGHKPDWAPYKVTTMVRRDQQGPVAFAVDGSAVYTQTPDGTLRWGLRDIEIPSIPRDHPHETPVFSTDDRYLMFGGWKIPVRAFDHLARDVTASRPSAEWVAMYAQATKKPVSDYRLSVHSEWYLKGFADESFRVADPDGNLLFELVVPGVGRVNTGPAATATLRTDGRQLFLSTADFSRSHLYPLDPSALIRQVDAAGYRLTPDELRHYGIE